MNGLDALTRWLDGRRTLVVGLGKSGAAAATLLSRCGARVAVTESRPAGAVAEWTRRLPRSVARETGRHRLLDEKWDLIVPSPGVSARVWSPAARRGAWVWGELELGYRALCAAGRWPARTAAITGTNGKTTTTALLGAMARADGRPTVVGGNIGTPLCDLIDDVGTETVLILEVSSYQLETASAFRPAVGAVLNVTPDHLGRHGTLENYARTKFRMFQNQGTDDAGVLNDRDLWCRRLAGLAPGRVTWFGRRSPGVRWDGRRLRSSLPGAGGAWPAPAHLPGRHNIENAEAATACARLLGLSAPAIARALRDFPGVEHRLESVRRWRGVDFVNDSKATNVDSTRVALQAFGGPVRLILGGEHKGSPYRPLRELLPRRVAEILLIGEAAPLIARDLQGSVPVVRCGTLAAAVQRAAATARRGDTVLLSPACASFDQFLNFEDRGRRFKKLVDALP